MKSSSGGVAYMFCFLYNHPSVSAYPVWTPTLLTTASHFSLVCQGSYSWRFCRSSSHVGMWPRQGPAVEGPYSLQHPRKVQWKNLPLSGHEILAFVFKVKIYIVHQHPTERSSWGFKPKGLKYLLCLLVSSLNPSSSVPVPCTTMRCDSDSDS